MTISSRTSSSMSELQSPAGTTYSAIKSISQLPSGGTVTVSESGSATVFNATRTDNGEARSVVTGKVGIPGFQTVRNDSTAITAGTTFGRFYSRGSIDTSGTLSQIGPGIAVSAAETFTSTAQGTRTEFRNTRVGTTSVTVNGGAFGDGTGGMFVGANLQTSDLVTKLQITGTGTTPDPTTYALKTFDSSNNVQFSVRDDARVFINTTGSGLKTAANNAAASAAGVAIGELYRTNADPSVICIRTA